jgi:hypothetical protein
MTIYIGCMVSYLNGRFKMGMEIEDGEPVFHTRMDGEDQTWTWWNTCVFTHRPAYSEYDHVFIELEPSPDENTQAIGKFVFRQVVEGFDNLVELLDDYCFPHLIKPNPSEGDMRVWERMNLADLDNSDDIAEKWLQEAHKTGEQADGV